MKKKQQEQKQKNLVDLKKVEKQKLNEYPVFLPTILPGVVFERKRERERAPFR